MIQTKLDIIFENENIVAINKTAQMLSVPDRMNSQINLKHLLIEKYNEIFVIHRLDRDTSGVIIFAKNAAAQKYFNDQFENRIVQKYYAGLVVGQPLNNDGVVDKKIGPHPIKLGSMYVTAKGKESLTTFDVIEKFKFHSYLDIQIHTGRTHQIRVHMQFNGTPIVCDELYGNNEPVLLSSYKNKYKLGKFQENERPLLQRLGLHSKKLIINDLNNQKLIIEAPLQKDFRVCLEQLKKNS